MRPVGGSICHSCTHDPDKNRPVIAAGGISLGASLSTKIAARARRTARRNVDDNRSISGPCAGGGAALSAAVSDWLFTREPLLMVLILGLK
jgi:hypothetical protein